MLGVARVVGRLVRRQEYGVQEGIGLRWPTQASHCRLGHVSGRVRS